MVVLNLLLIGFLWIVHVRTTHDAPERKDHEDDLFTITKQSPRSLWIMIFIPPSIKRCFGGDLMNQCPKVMRPERRKNWTIMMIIKSCNPPLQTVAYSVIFGILRRSFKGFLPSRSLKSLPCCMLLCLADLLLEQGSSDEGTPAQALINFNGSKCMRNAVSLHAHTHIHTHTLNAQAQTKSGMHRGKKGENTAIPRS